MHLPHTNLSSTPDVSRDKKPTEAAVEQQPQEQPQEQPQQQPQQQQQQLLLPQPQGRMLGAPQAACWKSSSPGTPNSVNCHQPPRLSLSAILPVSIAGSHNRQHQEPSKKNRSGKRLSRSQHSRSRSRQRHPADGSSSNDSEDRTMLPSIAGRGPNADQPESPGSSLAQRFFANPAVRRSLLIDSAILLVFLPLSLGCSLALMRLFVRRVGQEQLEWHHYMLVAALGSLALVPLCRLAYSCNRYRKRLRRMRAAEPDYQLRHPPLERHSDYTAKSRRIEADGAARAHAQEYHQFAQLVARQQNIDLSRRGGDLSGLGKPAAADRSAANISGISCHRPDISMAAYHC